MSASKKYFYTSVFIFLSIGFLFILMCEEGNTDLKLTGQTTDRYKERFLFVEEKHNQFVENPISEIKFTKPIKNNLSFDLVGTDSVGDSSNGAGDLVELYISAKRSMGPHYNLTFYLVGSSDICSKGSDVFFHGEDGVNHYYIGYYDGKTESGRYQGQFRKDDVVKGSASCEGNIAYYNINTFELDDFKPIFDGTNSKIGIWAASWDSSPDELSGDDFLGDYNASITYVLPE